MGVRLSSSLTTPPLNQHLNSTKTSTNTAIPSRSYNIGILATLYVSPSFQHTLGAPSSATTGLITAIYYLGTWTSYIFVSGPLSDRLGRRYACLVGTLTTCVGAAIITGARGTPSQALAMMILGRIIAGLGNAVLSTSVPLYQSEIAPASRRGALVVMNHIGLVTGLAVAFWVGYGLSFYGSSPGEAGWDVSWRLSVAVQFIPAVIFISGLPFCVETPRWLLEKGRVSAARSSLVFLRGRESSPLLVEPELQSIISNIQYHHSISPAARTWRVLFSDKDLFARLWRVALLQFMAQMCGATAMKYYLPTNFIALGLSKTTALLAGGIESTLKIGCTIIEAFLIDRLGRRGTLLLGTGFMAVAMLINGVLPLVYPGNLNRASDYACVVFIFLFSFGYSISFGPNAWVYGTELFPTYIRARGVSISASGGAVGSIVVAQIWPVMFARVGSRTYFLFMSVNVVSLVVLGCFYPETKGKTLEEMEGLFSRAGGGGDGVGSGKVGSGEEGSGVKGTTTGGEVLVVDGRE